MGGWLLSRTELRLCALRAVEENERIGSSGVFSPYASSDGELVYWTTPTARFTIPPGAALEFQVRSGAREAQRLGVRLGGETIDERTVQGAEWQRVRYVARAASEEAAILELTATPPWRPPNDFRTIGVGLDRVW